MPFWRYEIEDVVIEKRILMPNRQNSAHVTYTLAASRGTSCHLELRPSLHFRPFEASVGTTLAEPYEVRTCGRRFEIDSHEGFPPLRLLVCAAESRFVQSGGSTREISYERDAARGYESRGLLWSPGVFEIAVRPGEAVTLVASTEEWHTIEALDPAAAYLTERARGEHLRQIAHPDAKGELGAELVLAADQFIIAPTGRVKDTARARAAGDELRTVIAGYHWFTDWGRDTMISLEGITLVTGRYQEAAWILRAFAHYVRGGLIPNMFPEGKSEGLYHTADATLWFFHALGRYVEVTEDIETLHELLPVLQSIVEAHLKGTDFGIGVDPADGLLRQGMPGYQLTWMDAKVGDWVVTPRRGKAVEINGLWYNALRLLESWLRFEEESSAADSIGAHAARAQESFNRRFWNPETRCLFDVVDGEGGDDPAIRPNQLLSFSLTHPVLDREHWEPVLRVAEEKLLTPVGLRSLSPDDPDYQPQYTGDLRARDAAYHQGTVWAWLIGPFIDAWLKVHGENDHAAARRFLPGFASHVNEGCTGSVSEIFDAEPPFAERGCIAQAWSVAEVLRCWVRTARPRRTDQRGSSDSPPSG